MSANPKSTPGNENNEADRLEAAADQAIAACGGDMRSAIRALILANEFLEYEVKELMIAVSAGYSRGRFREPHNPLPADRKDWFD
jgi:hypothetical protein